MNAWPPQTATLLHRPHKAAPTERSVRRPRFKPRTALWLICLACFLVAQGVAIAHSYLWAAPLACVFVVVFATDIPLVPFLAVTLLVRVLTDASLSKPGAGSGTVNLSGGIALLLILVAVGLILRRRRGVWPAVLATLWLCLWTTIALGFYDASSETIRQGVREGAVVALAVIVYNSRGVVTVSVATRLVQLLGIAPALIAIYQFVTHTGRDIEGQLRAYGTFNHSDGAVMFFAIAAVASLWQYTDNGRRPADLLLTTIFGAAALATISLTGLVALLAMLLAFGLVRPGSSRIKARSFALAGLLVVVFLASPFGAARIANESSTQLSSGTTRGLASTSFGWRIYKWGTLIPKWEQAPFFGQGLGTTVSAEGTAFLSTAGKAPHNEYLRFLVETGVIGLGALLWAVAILIGRLARRRRGPHTLNAGALGIAIVVGCLVDSLADNTFLYTTTGYAAALVIAAVLAVPALAPRSTALAQP